jgi:putative hydrolase
MMVPEQRAIFNEMQALMCIVEGYSNFVMNAVGRQLLPSYESIAAKFEQRKRERGFAEQLFARLTGLDMKMAQYRLGEEFIDRVAAEHGRSAVDRIWASADNIPTMDEIRHPERWMVRVLAPVATG